MATDAELINVAVHFTHYAIKNKLLVKPGILDKDKLLMLYVQYQKQTSAAPRIECSEIIKALQEACLIKNRKMNGGYNCIEFKDQIFNSDEQVTMPATSTIRIAKREKIDSEKVELLSCDICKCSFLDVSQFKQHETTMIHQLRVQYRSNRKVFPKIVPFLEISDISNKNLNINQKKTFTINITNIADEPLTVHFLNVYNLCDLKNIKTNYDRGCSISNDFTFKFELIVNFDNYGAYIFPVVLEICTSEAPNKFIHLLIEPMFQVLSDEVSDLAPIEPYKPLKKTIVQIEKLRIIEGVPPDNSKYLLGLKLPLHPYTIPSTLRKHLDLEFKRSDRMDSEDEVYLTQIRSLLCDKSAQKVLHNKDALNQRNYVERFRYLMWIEEHQMDKDMRLYNQRGVSLILDNKRNLFELKVPGLAEGRPSVLRGDKVLVKEYFGEVKFEGIVHVIEETSVFLGFNESFKKSNVWKKKLYVEFSLDRFTLKMCHRALAQIQIRRIPAFMFPVMPLNNRKIKKVTLRATFNEEIRNNDEQMTAIKNIIENRSYPAPYILFGPPGTGKTATIVEAITQIWHLYGRSKKICVCAPSNSAADLITERLLKYNIPAYEIFRIYALSRAEADMPEKLRKCSNYDRFKKEYFFPSKEQIKLKSIVILTPMTAGRLVTGGFKGGHFDYLFMDEAGHSVEPEMIVPIIGLLTAERKPKQTCELQGNLILAGDPKQLGPVIRSTLATHLGLDMSLLERLMVQCKIYEKDPKTLEYNPMYITKLVHNYRSHGAILLVPNLLFYDNELKVSGNVNKINCASHWIELPKDNFPLIFHGVKGLEDREGNSPSYFNRFEIQVVGEYLKKLVNRNLGRRLVKEKDIGIITPYRKQVQKLKQYLRNQDMSDISVASVEEFQGQERLIIIITTVRSRFEFVAADYQFGLGFLRNAKRFNVAVTRAIALLIVIGNPDILQCDFHWRTLIQHCIENNSYLGDKPSGSLPPNFDPNDNISMDLPALTINADKIPEEEKPGFRTDF